MEAQAAIARQQAEAQAHALRQQQLAADAARQQKQLTAEAIRKQEQLAADAERQDIARRNAVEREEQAKALGQARAVERERLERTGFHPLSYFGRHARECKKAFISWAFCAVDAVTAYLVSKLPQLRASCEYPSGAGFVSG